MDLGEIHDVEVEMRRLALKRLDVISRIEWKASGYLHLWHLLKDALRITRAEAKRLAHQVELVCPKVGITGQSIGTQLPVVREAMVEGAISSDHLQRIAQFVEQVPDEHASQVEAELVELAYEFNPTEIAKLRQRIVDALDPNGPEPADVAVVEAQNELDLRQTRRWVDLGAVP